MPIAIYKYKKYAAVAHLNGTAERVVIPEEYGGVPVTEILEHAFQGSDSVRSVVVPKTLQYIGEKAFEGCKKLTQVTCQTDVPSDCSVLPKGLLSIGNGAFAKTALQNVKFLSEAAIKIGAYSFCACPCLNIVELPTVHTFSVGKRAFMKSGVKKFSAPQACCIALTTEAFSHCYELREFDADVVSVSSRCFYRCSSLRTFNFPDKFRMGPGAFEQCTSLEIPSRILLAATENDTSYKLPENSVFNLPVAEADSMRTPGESDGMEDVDHAKKQTLFDLICPEGKCVSATVRGKFYAYAGGFSFNEKTVYNVSNSHAERLRPLFERLVKEKLELVLCGFVDGQTLHVCSIDPADSLAPYPPYFFDEVARKLGCERVAEENRAGRGRLRLVNYPQMISFYDAVKTTLPDWVREAVLKNAAIFNESKGNSDEQQHAETALRYLLTIDWMPRKFDIVSDEEARAIMDKHFYGLDVVKERILEVLTKIRKTKSLPKYGLLLHGPPGVGKSSIARAIAEIFGIPYFEFHMSTFGRDPDEFSGSSRIYHNARPGRLADYMHDSRTSTALLLINEIDKAERHGYSAANVLLPVLDKVGGIQENFLQIELPVKGLFAVATANDINKISRPILDRFLLIDISAYSANDKRVILTDYALPKVLKENRLTREQLALSEEAVDLIIEEYALEAGARDLEKLTQRICSHCNKFLAGNPHVQSKSYSAKDITALLGPPKRLTQKLIDHPGIVTSAFCHENTGYTCVIEAAVIPGTGKFEVLGGIPAQQREYCKVAYYCVRHRVAFDLSKFDITVFSPQPIPESASNVGFACFAAICSKLTNASLLTDDAVFLGGIDLFGNLFADENDLTPILKAIKTSKTKIVYAPMGTAAKINPKELEDCNISIVEALDGPTLLTVAASGRKGA